MVAPVWCVDLRGCWRPHNFDQVLCDAFRETVIPGQRSSRLRLFAWEPRRPTHHIQAPQFASRGSKHAKHVVEAVGSKAEVSQSLTDVIITVQVSSSQVCHAGMETAHGLPFLGPVAAGLMQERAPRKEMAIGQLAKEARDAGGRILPLVAGQDLAW